MSRYARACHHVSVVVFQSDSNKKKQKVKIKKKNYHLNWQKEQRYMSYIAFGRKFSLNFTKPPHSVVVLDLSQVWQPKTPYIESSNSWLIQIKGRIKKKKRYKKPLLQASSCPKCKTQFYPKKCESISGKNKNKNVRTKR